MSGSATSALPLANAIWSSADQLVDMANLVATAREAAVGQTPKDVVWRKNRAHLYRYQRTTPATKRTPVVLILPLINRAYILDLRPGTSFVEHLLAEGHEVFLLDWGIWGPEDRGIDITTLVTRYIPRAVRAAARIASSPVTVLGYCIGGTLSTCYVALYESDPVRNLILFTTPIDFADAGRFGTWTAKGVFPIDRLRETYDVVPAEIIQYGAKLLHGPLADVATLIQLADRMRQPGFDPDAWRTMFRWVNEPTPFPAAAYYQWITEFYQDNRLSRGVLRMNGQPVLLRNIRVPFLSVAAASDPIAPRSTTRATVEKVGSADRSELVIEGGHVGIVVGRSAKRDLWPAVGRWLAERDG